MLLFPRTWYGILRFVFESPFVPIDAIAMLRSLACLVLPVVAIMVLNSCCLPGEAGVSLLPAFTSPWMLHSAYQTFPYMKQISQQIAKFQTGRFSALPGALTVIDERVGLGRLQRSRRLDVYFPPDSHNHDHQRQTGRFGPTSTNGVLLLPGALVPHSAYAEVAARLSDEGFAVAVVSFEPSRLAHLHLGADARSIRKIILKAEKILGHSNMRWALLGHSMGSLAATRIWAELGSFRELVLWGTGPFPSAATDLTGVKNRGSDILLIQGTKDTIVQFGISKGWQSTFEAMFPKDRTRWHRIENGTHDGFASYDEYEHQHQLQNRSIGLEQRRQQHEMACNVTSAFLQGAHDQQNEYSKQN